MNNRSKGFTLIELIGVIVIVALLALLIVPIVSNVVSSSKAKLYKNTLKNIELSAKDWFIDEDNIEKLPTNVDNCYINLSELKDEGLVDKDIKNPETGELLDDSKINILVTKNGSSYNFSVVDDGSTLGGQCSEYTPNILAPTINATTFNNYRKSFSLNITYDNLTSSDGNTFEYYLSDSSNSLHGGDWTSYSNNVAQTIGDSKTGTYYVYVRRLSNIIDGQTNMSTMGGVMIKIGNESYHRFGPYRFDNTKPRWSFYQKTNDNSDMADSLENMNYAYQEHTVTITFRGTDENYDSNSLTINNIGIKIGTADLASTATKSLSSAKTLSNGIEYTLTLSNMTQKGELSLVIPANTLTDKAGNTNNETTINTKIKVNMCPFDTNTTWTYTTPKKEVYKVPCDGTYTITAAGAKGGGTNGGAGATISGNITLKRNTVLNVYVGGQGIANTGGYNGGGYGGGGASDVRVGGTGYNNRIIVAGGGGGDGTGGGGAGGTYNGAAAGSASITSCASCLYDTPSKSAEPTSCNAQSGYSEGNPKDCVARYAQGGGQSASDSLYGSTIHFNSYVGAWTGGNGVLGEGGNGNIAGGGGAGFYGGGGGAATPHYLLAGAGGSSCISTNEDNTYNCKNNNFLFTSISATAGNNSGNGRVTIKLISA